MKKLFLILSFMIASVFAFTQTNPVKLTNGAPAWVPNYLIVQGNLYFLEGTTYTSLGDSLFNYVRKSDSTNFYYTPRQIDSLLVVREFVDSTFVRNEIHDSLNGVFRDSTYLALYDTPNELVPNAFQKVNSTGVALENVLASAIDVGDFNDDGTYLKQSRTLYADTINEYTASAGINLGSDALFVDETNRRVGINTITPDYELSVIGKMNLGDAGSSVFIGVNAGLNDDATNNKNIGIGWRTLYTNTTGFQNVSLGGASLYSNLSGYHNVSIGADAMYKNTSGSLNVALGFQSLYNNVLATGTVAIGYQSIVNAINGKNTGVGYRSLVSITTGQNITAIGYNSGRFISGGVTANVLSSTSTYLGAATKAFASGSVNETVIGYNAIGHGSNTVTLGNSSVTGVYIENNLKVNTINEYTAATGVTVDGVLIKDNKIDYSYISNVPSFTELDPVYTASQAFNITTTDITNLGNLSGTNTGDQATGTTTQVPYMNAAGTDYLYSPYFTYEPTAGLFSNRAFEVNSTSDDGFTINNASNLVMTSTAAQTRLNFTSGAYLDLQTTSARIDAGGDFYLSDITATGAGEDDFALLWDSELNKVTYGTAATAEVDPIYTGSQAFNIDANDITNLSNLSGTNTGDQTETDPIYSGSSAFSIDAGDITNLSNLSNTNTGDQDLSPYLTSEGDPIYSASQAFNIDATDITNLDNLSGVNTGDQDLSPYTNLWSENGANIYRISNVGIGTTSPQSNLHIYATTNPKLVLQNGHITNDAIIDLMEAGNDFGVTGSNGIRLIMDGGVNMFHIIGGVGTTLKTGITMARSTGYVGINNSNPTAYQFDVNGTGRFTGSLYANSNIYQGDNDWHYFGASNDAGIYHNGTIFYIRNLLHGGLIKLQGEDTATGANRALITADPDAGVTMYYGQDPTKYIQTTSVGAYVNGSLTTSSTSTATNFILSSDRRLKKNIKPINISKIDEVEIIEFNYKSDTTNRKRYGVIAQELEKIHPEMVYENSDGFKQVAYIDYLIAKIASLEKRLIKLENNEK